MKKIILSIVLLSFANAGSIDEYGRNLMSHERDGGHTILKHVGKTHEYLRERCTEGGKFYASFVYYRDAEKTLQNMIASPINRANINLYQRGGGRGASGILHDGRIVRGYRGWWSHFFRPWSGKGRGIDCSKLGKVKTTCRRRWWSSRKICREPLANYQKQPII